MQLVFSVLKTQLGVARSFEETANIDMLFVACCEYIYGDNNDNKNFIINVKDTVIISHTFLTGTGARCY